MIHAWYNIIISLEIIVIIYSYCSITLHSCVTAPHYELFSSLIIDQDVTK